MGFFLLAKSFFGGIFSFLIKNWKIVLPVILVVVALLYVNHLRNQHVKDQAQIKEDAVIIQDWSDKFGNLKKLADEAAQVCKDIIADQNKHVELLASQAEKYKIAAAAASKANASIKKEYESKIQQILNQAKPQNDHESIQYLIDFAKNAGKWEETKDEQP